jgi:hypothetical protein
MLILAPSKMFRATYMLICSKAGWVLQLACGAQARSVQQIGMWALRNQICVQDSILSKIR